MVGETAYIDQYLNFIISELVPGFFSLLDKLAIAANVSWLDFIVALILLCLFIGSIVMRV